MTVCAFFLKGNCRYGNGCKYQHLNGGNQKSNPLPGPDSFSVVAKTMRDDLLAEKPAYYLSVYSPHKSCPNMIDDNDLSPEELRSQAYQARANNTIAQYIAHESQLLQKMDSVIQMVSSSPIESYKHFYHTQVPLNHPNSTFRKPTPGVTAFGGNTFGPPNPTTAFPQPTSAFGAPSMGAFGGAFGKQPTAATVSAFGQQSPVRSGVSAFGQPQSAFSAAPSQPNVTAFGNPSPFGTPAPVASAFGATATTASAFGQPSRFGTATAFGTNLPQTTGASAFGAPSAFGANTSAVTAFGQPSLNNSTTAFGQPTSTAPTSFGQPAGTAPTTSFGQPAGTAPSTSFGQLACTAPTTSFGQPSPFGRPLATTPFGKPSAFGQAAFGQPAGTNTTSIATSAFGQPAFGGSATAFGQATPSLVNNQVNSNVGFAAFAGSTPSPLKPSNDLGMGNTTPPELSEGNKTQNPSFQQSPPTTTPPASAFHQGANTPTVSKSSFNAKNQDKSADVFKTIDPFWEDAPVESDLLPDILQAFQAESFSWGCIPHVPPPITLR